MHKLFDKIRKNFHVLATLGLMVVFGLVVAPRIYMVQAPSEDLLSYSTSSDVSKFDMRTSSDTQKKSRGVVRFDNAEVIVEVMSTLSQQTRGLSGRELLEEGSGMLFAFGEAGSHGIWMKDMKFAIDILWFDDQFRVVHIEQAVVPETYPRVFDSEEDSFFVLEVPSGWVEKSEVMVGDRARFEEL